MRVRKARLRARLTQRRAADLMGVGRATVQRWERGVDVPGARALAMAAKVLDTSVYYLTGIRDTPERGLFPSEDGRAMLEIFEKLPPDARQLMIGTARDLLQAQKATSKT